MSADFLIRKPFLKIPVPLYSLLIAITLTIVATCFLYGVLKSKPVVAQSANAAAVYNDCQVEMIRQNDYKLIHPLLMADGYSESGKLQQFKTGLTQFVNQKVNSGLANSISVYVRELNDGNWVSINGGTPYYPGSIMKIGVLITWLEMSEKNPQALNKKILFKKSVAFAHMQTFDERPMTEGREYSVGELLKFMICNSDNDATYLLQSNMNMGVFQELFTDLGLPKPDINNSNLTISAEDYSKFFRILYNATYLNKSNSEFALQLLTKSDFNDGIIKQLPPQILVAHKFGERTDGVEINFHEAGIVYNNYHPYLIAVMTKGTDSKALASTISDISKYVFDGMNVAN